MNRGNGQTWKSTSVSEYGNGLTSVSRPGAAFCQHTHCKVITTLKPTHGHVPTPLDLQKKLRTNLGKLRINCDLGKS